MNKRGRHHEELSCYLEVQLFHEVNTLKILVGYLQNRYVIYVYLLFPDKVEKQIKRAFKGRQFKVKCFR